MSPPIHKTESGDFILPAGAWFFRPDGEDGFIYLRESDEVTMSAETENVEKRSHDTAIAHKMDEFETQRDYTISLSVEDISDEIIELFVGGSRETVNQTADTGVTDAIEIKHHGRWYRIGVDNDHPFGARSISDVTVDDGDQTEYTEGQDYEIDLRRATIRALEGGAIDEEDTIELTYDEDAVEYFKVTGDLSSKPKRGELMLQADNTDGPDIDYILPKVLLQPEGDLSHQDRDTYQSLGFSAQVLADDDGNVIFVEGEPVDAT